MANVMYSRKSMLQKQLSCYYPELDSENLNTAHLVSGAQAPKISAHARNGSAPHIDHGIWVLTFI